jgi:uncharacterized protein YneF (UPF0154 family)
MDEITMLSFTGIYILLVGGFIYNFYLSKKMYRLLDNNQPRNEGTMKKLINEGIKMQESTQEKKKGLLKL